MISQRGGDPALVAKEYLWVIEQAIMGMPRSQQTEIGPSEIGDECARRIGYKLLGRRAARRMGATALKTWVGTCVHLGLADAFDADNLRIAAGQGTGEERWLVETRLEIAEVGGETIKGTCDLFDTWTATVIDHKTTSPTRLAMVRKNGPDRKYRTQLNLYGLGWERRGYPVDTIMISFIPRDGLWDDAYLWWEPYDRALAEAELRRLEGIGTVIDVLGLGALASLPTHDAYCMFCPYLKINSTDLAEGCPGDPAMERRPPALTINERS